MHYGRGPGPGAHARRRRVFLRVSVLRELRRRDASEAEEERRLPKRVLHRFAGRHLRPHHVSDLGTPVVFARQTHANAMVPPSAGGLWYTSAWESPSPMLPTTT